MKYLLIPAVGLAAFLVFASRHTNAIDTEFIESGQSVVAPGPFIPPPPLPPAFSMTPEPDNAITLQRTRCYGACPAYVLRIESSGALSFSHGPPFWPGELRTSTITAEQYRDLVAGFLAIHFSEFKDVYPPSAEDLPTAYLKFTVDGKSKQVKHSNVSPPGLDELERTIERLANIHRWLHDTSQRLTLQSSVRDINEIEDLKNAHVVSEDVYMRIKPGMTELMQSAGGGGLQQEVLAAQRQIRRPSALDISGWITTTLGTELKRGDSVNAIDESGWTALMVASAMNKPESVSLLLNAGASVNQRDNHGDTALMATAGISYRDLAMAATVAKLLITHGSSPDTPNDNGETALMWAAKDGNRQLIRASLDAGANPHRLDRSGHYAEFYLQKARAQLTFDPSLVKRYDEAESILRRN